MVRLSTAAPQSSDLRPGLALPHDSDMLFSNWLADISTLVVPGSRPPLQPDDVDAYCVKCKTTHKMVGPQLVTTKNGKSAARGKCAVCGTTMMKFLPAR